MHTENLVEVYLGAGKTASAPLLPGIIDKHDAMAAMHDERTIFESATGMPIAVPLEHNSWYRPDYFIEHGFTQELLYFAGHRALAESIDIPYRDMVCQVAEAIRGTNKALVFEYSADEHQEMQRYLRQLELDSDLLLSSALKPGESEPVDYIFEATYKHKNLDAASGDFLQGVYNYDSATDGVSVQSSLSAAQIEFSYEGYKEAFRLVQQTNPMLATFEKDEYAEMMSSPDYIKFVCEDAVGIANICVANQVQLCSWIDQDFVRSRHPQAYDAGHVLFCPGIFSRPDASPALSLRTFGIAARSFASAGIEPVVIIECNEVSARYIPKLFTLATQKTKLSTAHVSEPLQEQRIEVLVVK